MIFSGIGNAFNTEMGNTSAYFKVDSELLLIDCGSSVFKTLKEAGVINHAKKIHVIITHTHPDHAGSLGDLIFYAFYMLKIRPHIYFPDQKLMETFFSTIGVEANNYTLSSTIKSEIKEGHFKDLSIEFIETKHVSAIPSFALILKGKKDAIYYSGDATDLNTSIVSMLEKKSLSRIYQDICCEDGCHIVHMPIEKLNEKVPEHLRNNVFCMHFENKSIMDTIKSHGYGQIEVFKDDPIFDFEK
jgi:ribonuclease BN (tRNA processing enzyme)